MKNIVLLFVVAAMLLGCGSRSGNRVARETPVAEAADSSLTQLEELEGWEPELSHRDSSALLLMNKLIGGGARDADGELQWADTVSQSIVMYCNEFGVSREQALEDMILSVDRYSGGGQSDINYYCWMVSQVAYFRTIDAYRELLGDVRDKRIHSLLLEEYRTWNRFNLARYKVYVKVQRAGDSYTALPMEFAAQDGAHAKKRLETLDIERSILLGRGSYTRLHPELSQEDWESYLRLVVYYNPDSSSESEESALAFEFKSAFDAWMGARRALTKALPASRASSYEALTADYHWVIANKEDSFDPSEV